MQTSVFEMVHQVLGDAKEKLAADKAASTQGVEKTAAASKPRPSAKPEAGAGQMLSDEYLGKLASACDHLASNLHLIEDQRTPAEKLAEAVAINQALMKKAFEGGDKKHQTTQANADSISPATVTTDSSGTASDSIGSGNAIPSAPNNAPGESLDAGQSGQAASAVTGSTTPNEKANPMDPANSMETNVGMMMPEQPEALLQQSGGDVSTGDKTAAARALRTIGKVSGRTEAEARMKVAQAKKVRVLLTKAAQAGIPQEVALAMLGLGKHAEDAINPATISGGTSPVLQQEPGVPSPLMQGSEAGSNTPRATAPTSGEGGGRELLSSNESAMNATKSQAKQQNKGAMGELLTEPMMSASRDSTLQKSLDNTSSAGVKISAMRSLLKKFAAASPSQAQKLAALAKLALDPAMADDPEAVPPEAAQAAAMEGAGEGEVPEAAEEAAAAGVTPEELAQALALLGEEGAAGEEEAAPEAGAEEPEKQQQLGMGAPMGGAPMGGTMGGAGTPSPTPMMS